MTRGSMMHYTQAVRGRYLKARKEERRRILDEFVLLTGYHGKAAIRLLQPCRPLGGQRAA